MLNKQSQLTDLDELFAQYLRDTTFANDVKTEISELNRAVAALKTKR